ncbi:MAG: KH domain-containing protein [Candidatus Freyarchaeota archaeon]|nr:KH domain-containing protein [Candidatus Jordarchaeia archaeon]
MKTPICTFCLKSGVLCPRCQEKVDKGEVSDLDIKVAKHLVELEERFSSLKDVKFVRAIKSDNLVVIVVGEGNIPNLIGPKGRVIKSLSDELGRKIRVIEESSSLKKTIEDIISPVNLLGVNTVWLPDGSNEKKVRIRQSESKKLPASTHVLEKIIYDLTGERVRFVFE